MKVSKFYRQQAWNSLSSNYWNLLLVSIVESLIVAAVSSVFPLYLLAFGFLNVAIFTVFIKNSRGEKVVIDDFFSKFFDRAEIKMASGCLVSLYTFLWGLLFIIPGIIKAFSYSMTFYLLSVDPSLSATDAINLSQKMMNGNKWKLFKLYFSFIGWIILACFTCGILCPFIYPYILAANVEFFNDVYAEYKESLPSV